MKNNNESQQGNAVDADTRSKSRDLLNAVAIAVRHIALSNSKDSNEEYAR
jgi:hypothetical protein